MMLDLTSKQEETVIFHYQWINVLICKSPWQTLNWQLYFFINVSLNS
jgi:hypothetical protein